MPDHKHSSIDAVDVQGPQLGVPSPIERQVASDRLQVLLRTRKDPNTYPVAPDASSGPAKIAGFQRLVNAWLDVFPDAKPDPAVDFEDWVENAVVLTAWFQETKSSMGVGLDLFIQEPRASIGEVEIRHFTWPGQADSTPEPKFNSKAPFVLAGPELKFGDFATYSVGAILPSMQDALEAADYARNPGFLKHAQRHIELCTYDDGDGHVDPVVELRYRLGCLRNEGHETVVLKLRETKAGIGVVYLKGRTDKQIQADLHAQLEWTLIEKAGQVGAFVVQAQVPMEHEYRLLVVDGNVVAGAGCIEEFTPLDNEGLDFDTRTRRIRGTMGLAKSEIESNPDIVQQYVAAATEIIRDLKAGSLGAFLRGHGLSAPKDPLNTFVLDLCMVNGQVAVVELNPARNYGLYAMNYNAIHQASKTAAKRHLDAMDASAEVTEIVSSVTVDAEASRPRRMRP